MLTDMQATLSGVLTAASSCEQVCLSLSESVGRLAAEGAEEAGATRALLRALEQATLQTKAALQSQSQGQAHDPAAVLAALEEMRGQFAEQLQQQQGAARACSSELQACILGALAQLQQQGADSDASSLVGVAATQQRLDAVLAVLQESSGQLAALQAMAAAQHQLLALVERRGNLLPRSFVVLPADLSCLQQQPPASFFKRLGKKARGVFWTKVRLFFV